MVKSDSGRIVLHKTLCPSVSLSELFTRVCENLGIVHYGGVGFVFSPLFDDKLWCTYVISVGVDDDDEGDIDDTYIMDDVGSRKGLISFLKTLRYLIICGKFKRYDKLKRWWTKLSILNKKLEFYKEVAFSIIMFLTMLSGVFFLVFAVIKLLS